MEVFTMDEQSLIDKLKQIRGIRDTSKKDLANIEACLKQAIRQAIREKFARGAIREHPQRLLSLASDQIHVPDAYKVDGRNLSKIVDDVIFDPQVLERLLP